MMGLVGSQESHYHYFLISIVSKYAESKNIKNKFFGKVLDEKLYPAYLIQ